MRVWKVMMLVAPLVVGLSVTPAPAQAQRGQGPCRDDIQKFCADVKPGGGRFRVCLQQHTAELSPACQQHLAQVKTRMATWRQACESDVQKLCSGVAPGRGGIIRCLHEHEGELSQACKDQLARRPRRGAPARAPAQ